MQKILNGIILIISILIILTITTAHSLLMAFTELPLGITEESLIQGRILPKMILQKGFWVNFPTVSHMRLLFQLRAFLLTIPLLIFICYFMRIKKKWDLLYVGLLCLCAGFIPYLVGIWALSGNTEPLNVAPWIRTMWMGVMYCAIACGILTAINIL